MSLLFVDSFGHYSNSERGRKWEERDALSTTAGISADFARFGLDQGYKMRNRLDWLAKMIPQSTRLIIGFGFNVTAGIDVSTNKAFTLLELFSPFNNRQCMLRLEENYGLGIVRSPSTLLGASPGGTITPNKYHFIEVDIEIANTADVEVRVDGETVLTLSNVDTQASSGADGVGRVVLGEENTISQFISQESIKLPGGRTSLADTFEVHIDDFYICDTNGAVNNSFLGDIRVEPLWPTGAGDYAQWDVSGGGSNFQAVDDVTPDATSTTVETDVIKELDLHEYDDSGGADGEVKALAANFWARQTTIGGFSSVVPAVKTGGAVYYGATAFPLCVEEWNCYQYLFEINPDTSSVWTIAELNALQAGYKRQS